MKLFVFSSILVIFITACSVQRSAPLSAELKKQISMLPADALVLGYVNVHQILSSPVYRLLNNETGADPFANKAYKKFIENTSFDLREHIQEMLFAGKNDSSDNFQGMFVAKGSFDAQKISEYIKNEDRYKKLKETNYGTFRLMSVEEDGFSMCFADSNHFVAGTCHLVQNWLDIFGGHKKAADIDVQLLKRVEKLTGRKSIWMVTDAGTVLETAENEGIGIAKGLKNIQFADIAVTMDESLQVFGRILCSDQEKAKLVHDAIRGFVASAKLTVSDDRDAVDVLNKIDVNTENEVVTGEMKLNQEELKKLLEKREILRRVEAV